MTTQESSLSITDKAPAKIKKRLAVKIEQLEPIEETQTTTAPLKQDQDQEQDYRCK